VEKNTNPECSPSVGTGEKQTGGTARGGLARWDTDRRFGRDSNRLWSASLNLRTTTEVSHGALPAALNDRDGNCGTGTPTLLVIWFELGRPKLRGHWRLKRSLPLRPASSQWPGFTVTGPLVVFARRTAPPEANGARRRRCIAPADFHHHNTHH
jgi:hypothetical protein